MTSANADIRSLFHGPSLGDRIDLVANDPVPPHLSSIALRLGRMLDDRQIDRSGGGVRRVSQLDRID